MNHPFFDVIVFPWNREEATRLHKTLVMLERDNAKIQNTYFKCMPDQPPSLTFPANADKIWTEVLDQLTSHNGLMKLFELMLTQFGGNQTLVNAIFAVEHAKPANEVQIFNDEIFILDCDIHRQAISKCTSDSSPKVLLIRGGNKSGKSHCRYILESIARDKNATVVYLYDGIISTLQEAVECIFSSLGSGPDKIPLQVTTEDAWYRTICYKLKEIATAQNRKIWIVVDDLGYINGGPMLDSNIRMFFEQFALFLLDFSFIKYFRLLLINYAEPTTPTKWKTPMWMEVETNENDIQLNHVEQFLKDWHFYKKSTIFEQDLKVLANEVIDNAQNPPTDLVHLCRLERIHTILTLKLDEILKSAS